MTHPSFPARRASLAAALGALAATAALFAGPAWAAAPASDGLTVVVCPAPHPVSYAVGGDAYTTLALPRVAVLNDGPGVYQVSDVRAELLKAGHVLSKRELDAAAVRSLVPATACAVQAGTGTGTNADVAAGVSLGHAQALLLDAQVFGWTGARDALRIVIRGTRDGESHVTEQLIPLPAPLPAA